MGTVIRGKVYEILRLKHFIFTFNLQPVAKKGIFLFLQVSKNFVKDVF